LENEESPFLLPADRESEPEEADLKTIQEYPVAADADLIEDPIRVYLHEIGSKVSPEGQ